MLASSLAFLFAVVNPAFAGDDKPAPPPVKVGGIILGNYGLHLTDGYPNAFELDRVYLVATADVAPNFGTRVTLDADLLKEQATVDSTGAEVVLPQDTKMRVFVKHAYLEYRSGMGVKVRAGMIDTPWGPFYDQHWEHRYISDSFTASTKVLSTADLGVGAIGEHGDGLFKWHLNFVNGEGYGKVEVDAGKTTQLRLTVDPLAGKKAGSLPISGYVSYGFPGSDGSDGEIMYAAAVGLKKKPIILWAEYVGHIEGDVSASGFSASVVPRIPKILNIIGRVDRWDPDANTENDATLRIIGGLGHDFAEKISVSATFEREAVEGFEDEADNAIFLRMQAGY